MKLPTPRPMKLETGQRTRLLNVVRYSCATEFHYDESNRVGICSFDRRRSFRSIRRNGASCRSKRGRCDKERTVRARRDAAALYGRAKKHVHQAMSGQQRAVARQGCSSSAERSSVRPKSNTKDCAVRRRQSA
jgi:hypothetical protein